MVILKDPRYSVLVFHWKRFQIQKYLKTQYYTIVKPPVFFAIFFQLLTAFFLIDLLQ